MPVLHNKKILLLFVAFIVYGSLYPFDFTTPTKTSEALYSLFHIEHTPPRWGDLLSNVFLFIPFGFLGLPAAIHHDKLSRGFATIILSGAILAFGLQCAQVFLPTRFPSLLDALCNVLGITLGGLLFLPVRTVNGFSLSPFTRPELLASGLIGVWVVDNLWPLIPGIDLHTLKEGLKPLFLQAPTLSYKLVKTIIHWLLIFHLWEFVQKRRIEIFHQIAAASLMAILEILMEGNAIEWDELLGMLLALGLWNLWIHRFRRRIDFLIVLLGTILAWKGFTPFLWRETPASFFWMPFGNSILGDPLFQISVLIEKGFHYGCLAWLIVERNTPRPWALAIPAGFFLSIEYIQRFLVGHSPEITDPLLAVLLTWIIFKEFHRDLRETPALRYLPGKSSKSQPSLSP